MAAEAPLAEVLTGLELLLARSQLWQESAAQHVSLARQLERLAALALRWRRMQLHAWRHTIHKLKARHAAGAQSCPCFLICVEPTFALTESLLGLLPKVDRTSALAVTELSVGLVAVVLVL